MESPMLLFQAHRWGGKARYYKNINARQWDSTWCLSLKTVDDPASSSKKDFHLVVVTGKRVPTWVLSNYVLHFHLHHELLTVGHLQQLPGAHSTPQTRAGCLR